MYDIKKLPKWAQEHIGRLENKIRDLQALEQMHAILSDKSRNWFAIPPAKIDGWEHTNLYILKDNAAVSVCSLGKGDLLFVGRAEKD